MKQENSMVLVKVVVKGCADEDLYKTSHRIYEEVSTTEVSPLCASYTAAF